MIRPTPVLTIGQYVEIYIQEHVVCPEREKIYERDMAQFEQFAGGPVLLTDLRPELVNRYLIHLERSGRLTPETIRGKRSTLLALWNAAYQAGIIDNEPKRIRPVIVPAKIPQAWSPEQVNAVLEVAAMLKGRLQVSRISRPHYWCAFIRTAWDTGLRLSDLRRIPADVRHGDGRFMLTQGKTGWPVRCCLQPETLEAIRATFPPERPTVLGVFANAKHYTRQFRRLAELAGLDGNTRALRKSSATWIESQLPGGATRFLGHKTSALAMKCYIDPRLVDTSLRQALPNVLGPVRIGGAK